MFESINITTASENSLILRFSDSISSELPLIIAAISKNIKQELGLHCLEIIPAYTTLLVKYDLNHLNQEQCIKLIKLSLKKSKGEPGLVKMRQIYIPVCYDLSVAPDLLNLAKARQLTPNEVVKIHSQAPYQVYAMGFSPAFAYLGLVDKRIAHPRHKTPRLNIPSGSIGIADNQTAIYPINSPAGWQIIGRTPLDLSLKNPANLTFFQVGDKIHFKSISLNEFNQVKAEQNDGV